MRYFFLLLGLAGLILGLSFLWNNANHTWKNKPARPLIWALAFGVVGLLLWAFLDNAVLKLGTDSAVLPVEARLVVQEVAQGYVLTQKVVEWFFLPLVIALLGIAFSSKVEKQDKSRQQEIADAEGRLGKAREKLESATNEIQMLLKLPVEEAYGRLERAATQLSDQFKRLEDCQDELRRLRK